MAIDVKDWYYRLRQVICWGEFAEPLRGAALAGHLGQWTRLLTRAVAETCHSCGWVTSAKEQETKALPVPRQEYLGLDVIAFDSGSPEVAPQWRLPVAVFELENRENLDIIAYSLWKVIVVRCALRGVFCYRRQPEQVPQLVASLGQMVVDSQAQAEETPLLLVVGTRSKAGMFPDGFFQPYQWDMQWRRFRCLL
jgi:hypothetical protein